MFNIKNIYIKKIINKCIGENLDVSSIISFQKKLKYIFPLSLKKMKRQFEKIQFETKEKRLILDTIEEFIYELNISKKIKKKENNNIKEFNQNFDNVYSNSKDKIEYFNDNINIMNDALENIKFVSFKNEHLKDKVSSIYQKMKKKNIMIMKILIFKFIKIKIMI